MMLFHVSLSLQMVEMEKIINGKDLNSSMPVWLISHPLPFPDNMFIK